MTPDSSPTAIVHDLGCTEPCTCGAWDRAVGESDRDEAAESDEDDAS